MCLHNPKKTYSRRKYAWKIVRKGLSGRSSSVFFNTIYTEGLNISNRNGTALSSVEKKLKKVSKGFHLFHKWEDVKRFMSSVYFRSDYEVWKVSVKREHEVAYGTCEISFVFTPVEFDSCVYTQFTFVKVEKV